MYEMFDSSKRLRQPFINGVHDFVSKAMNQVSYIPDERVRCNVVVRKFSNLLMSGVICFNLTIGYDK